MIILGDILSMLPKNKKIVAISIDKDKLKEIKEKAVASEMTVSDFLVHSASAVSRFYTKTIPVKSGK